MQLSFDDTRIAFSGKTNGELKRAVFLFRMMNNPFLVKTGIPLLKLAFALRLPIKSLVRGTIFRQFCGGETLDECRSVIDHLASFRIGTIPDFAVEGEASEEALDGALQESLRVIAKAKSDRRLPFTVFKPTGIARLALLEKKDAGEALNEIELHEFSRAVSRFETIAKASYDAGIPVMVDAEESWIQKTIDEITEGLMRLYNRERPLVYNTVQMYRTDRLEYLRRLIEDAREKKYIAGVKVVRGAYMEKERKRAAEMGYPSPIHPDKEHTDEAFDAALELCVKNKDVIALFNGTHNEKSCLFLARLMEREGISAGDGRIFFSQLYGMSDHISFNLANAGYNVAKYVPYGPVEVVMPYLFRRAQENTAISGQTSRELSLLLKEMRRRGKGGVVNGKW